VRGPATPEEIEKCGLRCLRDWATMAAGRAGAADDIRHQATLDASMAEMAEIRRLIAGVE